MYIVAYLFFNGNCHEALQFYKKALNGEITMESKGADAPNVAEEDKDKIMHARLKVGDAEIYFSDSFHKYEAKAGTNIHLSLQVDKAEQVDKLCSSLSEGGKVSQAPQDTFWGARFAMLTDKYGFHWMLNCDLKK